MNNKKIIKRKTMDIIINNKLDERIECQYDEQGRITSKVSSSGYIETITYGDNIEQMENNKGERYLKTFTDDGKELTYQHSSGESRVTLYNDNGNIIYTLDNLGNEYIYEYNTLEDGRKVCYKKDKKDDLIILITEYYDNGNKKLVRAISDGIILEEYNQDGKIIYKNQDGNIFRYKYEGTKMICYNEKDIPIYTTECDKNENLISSIVYSDKGIVKEKFLYDEYNTCIFTKITGDNHESIITCDIEYYN